MKNMDKKYDAGRLIAILLLMFAANFLQAQTDTSHVHHHDHDMQMDHGKDTMMQMTSSFSPNLPMNRDGSGTSWQPDESPMMMYMKMFEKGKHGMSSLRVHGTVFLRYTSQDIGSAGSRGGSQFDSPNWVMLMFTHQHSKDLFSVQSMLSFDPLTIGGNGYPLLFQSGETYNGKPLVDRQHPHDLFAGLSANYTHSFNKDVDLNAYIGYPGEPALGPVVFMHRVSAMNNPDAALGHHWQDATHITFGVGTIVLRYKIIKMEGSIFTGREPDEDRYDFDQPLFDSYSYRVSVNPNRFFALQFSQGFIHIPEALEASVDIVRTTASVIHTKQFSSAKFIASSFIWGMNSTSEGQKLHSLLAESNLKLAPITIYSRYEFVQKNAHELALEQFSGDPVFNIHAFTLGVNRILFSHFQTDLSLGLQGTINFPDERLEAVYGKNPVSAEVYLRISPSLNMGH